MSPPRTIAHNRRAIDTKLNRDVAVKILESFAGDPDRLTRFAREAQVLAWLNHQHRGDLRCGRARAGAKSAQ